MSRSHLDGKPFYCEECGCGFAEYMACEEPECRLESKAEAMRRANTYKEQCERAGVDLLIGRYKEQGLKR